MLKTSYCIEYGSILGEHLYKKDRENIKLPEEKRDKEKEEHYTRLLSECILGNGWMSLDCFHYEIVEAIKIEWGRQNLASYPDIVKWRK